MVPLMVTIAFAAALFPGLTYTGQIRVWRRETNNWWLAAAITGSALAIACCCTFLCHRCCSKGYENNCFPMVHKKEYDTTNPDLSLDNNMRESEINETHH